MKRSEADLDLKVKHLTVQVAQTEKIAKRILLKEDPSLSGTGAKRLIDLEKRVFDLTRDKTRIQRKLCHERQKCSQMKRHLENSNARLHLFLKGKYNLPHQIGRQEEKTSSPTPEVSSRTNHKAKSTSQPLMTGEVATTILVETKNALQRNNNRTSRNLKQLESEFREKLVDTNRNLNTTNEKLKVVCEENIGMRLQLQDLDLLKTSLQQQMEEKKHLTQELELTQERSFAASCHAVEEITSLKRNLRAIQLEKERAIKREAETRRELLQEYETRQHSSATEYSMLKKRMERLQLENQKLRIELAATYQKLGLQCNCGIKGIDLSTAQQEKCIDVDEQKDPSELKLELRQLRSVYLVDQERLNKMTEALLIESTKNQNLERVLYEKEQKLQELEEKQKNNETARLERESVTSNSVTPKDVILTLLSPDKESWPDLKSHLIIHVEGLTLNLSALECPEVKDIVVVQTLFLDAVCPVELQTSPTLPKCPEMNFNTATAYALKHHSLQDSLQRLLLKKELRVVFGVVSKCKQNTEKEFNYWEIGHCEVDLLVIMNQEHSEKKLSYVLEGSENFRKMTGSSSTGILNVQVFASEVLQSIISEQFLQPDIL